MNIHSELTNLSEHWKKLAHIKFEDAKHEKNEMGKRLIEHGATCYFNCHKQLDSILKTGDIATDFSLEILKKNTESPR